MCFPCENLMSQFICISVERLEAYSVHLMLHVYICIHIESTQPGILGLESHPRQHFSELPWNLICVALHCVFQVWVSSLWWRNHWCLCEWSVYMYMYPIFPSLQIYALPDETVHSITIGWGWSWEGGLICSTLCYQHHQTSQWPALYASVRGTGQCRRYPAQTTSINIVTCASLACSTYSCVGDIDLCVAWRLNTQYHAQSTSCS